MHYDLQKYTKRPQLAGCGLTSIYLLLLGVKRFLDKGELELSSDYEEFYFYEEVVEDFFLEVMAVIFKAGKQLVEDYEEKDS